MSGVHANLAPSAAHRWMRCFASTAMEQGLPDRDSEFAAEGTRAHSYAAWILDGKTKTEPDGVEMVEHVNAYVGRVRALAKAGNYVALIEQRVDMTSLVPECWGTSDAIIIADDELIVDDLKFGMGERVDAEDNEQGQLYALGAFLANRDHHDFVQPFRNARIIIDQPRLNHLSEWTISIDGLMAFAERARSAAETNIMLRDTVPDKADIPRDWFNPGTKQCRWCKAYSTCPAAMEKVQAAMAQEYQVQPPLLVGEAPAGAVQPQALLSVQSAALSAAMAQVEFVENWTKAVRAATFAELQQGRTVVGWKLVQGRQGNRAWTDEAGAEKILKLARLKLAERCTFKLISPTAAEKILKDKPTYWAKAQAFITRADGGLSVAPESDARPAFSLVAEYEAQPDLTEYA
jgi:hypothetical protein